MATSNTYFARPNFVVEMNGYIVTDTTFELDESDIWNVSVCPELCKNVAGSPITKRSKSMGIKRGQSGGIPVSVPDWCKMRKEYVDRRRYDDDGDEGYEFGEERIPPHEFLARKRMASFSVHEGIGRTLKGRDLSRVRNAIWEKIGFED